MCLIFSEMTAEGWGPPWPGKSVTDGCTPFKCPAIAGLHVTLLCLKTFIAIHGFYAFVYKKRNNNHSSMHIFPLLPGLSHDMCWQLVIGRTFHCM